MFDSTLPLEQIDLEAFRQLLEQLDTAIKSKDNSQIISTSTAALDELIQSHLFVLSDICAHANAKEGFYDDAYSTAEDMLAGGTKQSTAYARLGYVNSMFGRQQAAIKAYENGLITAGSDQALVEQLTAAKAAAIEKSEIRVNFLSELPVEITNNIIPRLSKYAKILCLSVSREWRKRVLDCLGAWTELEITESPVDLQLVNILPDVGPYIEKLELNTDNDQIRAGCLQHIINKRLDKVQALKLKATRDWVLYNGRVSIAFWQMRETLKSVTIDHGGDKHGTSLADILLPCKNLTDLIYTATSMTNDRDYNRYGTGRRFTSLVGDLSTMGKHSALINLELKTNALTDGGVKCLLQRCPQLRRLVINWCAQVPIGTVTKYGTNLEIFAYNYSTKPVPALGSISGNKTPGLRKLFIEDLTQNRSPPTLACVTPLIHKNMATLDTLILNGLTVDPSGESYSGSMYTDLKLKNLKQIRFYASRSIQPVISSFILETTTLEYLSLMSVYDIQGIVDILMTLPPLFQLYLSDTRRGMRAPGGNERRSPGPHDSLTQLFEKYAAISRTDNTKTLKVASFRCCEDIVTDPVLTSLAGIQSLTHITLCELINVTATGVGDLLENLPVTLNNIELTGIHAVTDSHIAALRKCPVLVTISLERLQHVSDQGIRDMLNNKPHVCIRPCYRAYHLNVTSCPLVTDLSIEEARIHVKNVVYSKRNM